MSDLAKRIVGRSIAILCKNNFFMMVGADEYQALVKEWEQLINEELAQGGRSLEQDEKLEAQKDPEVIYLQPTCCTGPEGRLWCEDDVFDCPDEFPSTKYRIVRRTRPVDVHK